MSSLTRERTSGHQSDEFFHCIKHPAIDDDSEKREKLGLSRCRTGLPGGSITSRNSGTTPQEDPVSLVCSGGSKSTCIKSPDFGPELESAGGVAGLSSLPGSNPEDGGEDGLGCIWGAL